MLLNFQNQKKKFPKNQVDGRDIPSHVKFMPGVNPPTAWNPEDNRYYIVPQLQHYSLPHWSWVSLMTGMGYDFPGMIVAS
jgi:hypothetical protein